MIPTYFSTQERIEQLEAEAKSWIGTPFFGDGMAKGLKGGVCCHLLCYSILRNIEAIPELPIPRKQSPGLGGQIKLAKMSAWMNEQPCWVQLPKALDRISEITLIGDIVSFRIKRGEWHLGVRLPDEGGQTLRFIHCLPAFGVTVSNLHDATYDQRTFSAWRVKP